MAVKIKPVALWRREIENKPGAVGLGEGRRHLVRNPDYRALEPGLRGLDL
jgi:hypothetical protein